MKAPMALRKRPTYLTTALTTAALTAATLVAVLPLTIQTAEAQGINVTQTLVSSSAQSQPFGITAGPDGALWFADIYAAIAGCGTSGSIGRITVAETTPARYSVPGFDTLQAITAGSDGNLWFTMPNLGGSVGYITTAGNVVMPSLQLPDDGYPFDITSGPDGALWVAGGNYIFRITTAGVVSPPGGYPLQNGHSGADSITVGPDGALWFTEDGRTNIGRITTAGVFANFPVNNPNPESQEFEGDGFYSGTIVAGPDGALWFTEPSNNAVVRMTTAGMATTIPLSAGSTPIGITSGPDGALWIVEKNANQVARVTTATSPVVQEYPLPPLATALNGPFPYGITTGPDGALWFTSAANVGCLGQCFLRSISQPAGLSTKDRNVRRALAPLPDPTGIIGRVEIIPQLTVTASCPTNTAVLNSPYSFSITTSGGLAPLTWKLASGSLPPGLTLNTLAPGEIGGTPTATGTYPYSVTVTDSSYPTPQTVTFNCSITVATQLTITSSCPAPAGYPTAPYAYALTASGGTQFDPSSSGYFYQWSITPSAAALPPGLSLANTGAALYLEQVQGVPTTPGIYPFTLQAQDAGGQVATEPCSITIVASLTITAPAALPNGVLGAPYSSTTFQAQGGTTPYSWSATGLPPGLTLSLGGVLAGTPAALGTYSPTIKVSSLVSVYFAGYPLPAGFSEPLLITAGPDGALWFAEHDIASNKIGRITTAGALTEYPIPTAGAQPDGITPGPDGALWFAESAGNKIGRITTAGVFTEYPVPTAGALPDGITTGPDGALWFTEGIGNKIGRITTAGVLTEYPVPAGSGPNQITQGPDGALWFTEIDGDKVGRITTAGVLTEFPIPTAGALPEGIAAGPDGALWFTENFDNKIGRITTAGVVTEYLIPTADSGPYFITAGPDNALWFAEASGKIGRITTAGIVSEYPIPTAGSSPHGITTGADGALWFTNGNTIGRASILAETAQKTYTLTISLPALTISGACPTPPGNQGLLYVLYPITVSGGDGVYHLTFTGPAWLSLAASSGTAVAGAFLASLNGIPPATGTYPFSVQVADTGGSVPATYSCSITINPPPLEITSGCPASPLPAGTPFSETLSATGGSGSGSWIISSGSLPTGLQLNGAVISGTPQGPPGVSNFTIQLSSGGEVATVNCSVTVTLAQLKFTGSCPGNGTVGVPYGPLTLTAAGGLGQSSYTFSYQGSLPAGVGLSGNTVSGTPTTAGSYSFTFQVTSGTQSANGPSCSVTIALPALNVKGSCSAASVNVGSPFSMSVTVSGGQSPYSFSLSGASWLTLGPPSGSGDTASGTPTAPNGGTTYTAVITANDSANSTPASFSCTIVVNSLPKLTLSISCPASSIPPGTPVNVPLGANGGLAPYSWAISGNSGLSLSSSTGSSNSVAGNAPASAGSYSFSVTLSDSVNSPSASQGCSFTVPYSQLQIQGNCPASSLSVPVSLSVPLTAAGGQGPYTWGLSAPSWLGLSTTTGSSSSVVSTGTPSTSGPFSFTVSLTDSTNTSAAPLMCASTINPPSIPSLTITGLNSNGNSLQTVNVGVQLASPAPLPLTGILQLTFTPNAFGITNNPQVVFSGGGTQATFTIAAGQTTPTIPLPGIQQGTVAGTIQVQLIDFEQGSNEVLPVPAPLSTLVIPQQAPVITAVCFANQSASSFDVLISGYSNPRTMISVTLSFQPATGTSLNGTTSFTENVANLFTQFYSTAQSQLAGSLFTGFDVPVNVSGNESAIGGVTVTLTNSIGGSQPFTQSLTAANTCTAGSS